MAQKSYRQTVKGPPEVRPWHTLNPRRDGSPCVLERKFGYVKTRHMNLAKAEKTLAEVKALPEEERHPDAIENLKRSVDNHRAWLMFSIRTLEEHCRFAVSRFDGSLDEIQPCKSSKRRGKSGGGAPKGGKRKKAAEVRKLVNYYLNELPAYLACCAVAAKNSEQHEAMALLMKIARPVVEKLKRKSPRPEEEAEALAWEYLMEKTAHKFNPADPKSNMAAFNTYFTYGAKRSNEKRSKADAGIGEYRLPGKQAVYAKIGTLHTTDSDKDSAAFHPGTYDEDPTTKLAVANALSALSDDERQFAVMRFMEQMSIRQIAEECEISTGAARRMEKTVSMRLREALCDFGG